MGRRLGQHFLSDPGILDRIVDAAEPEPDDVVLEIGAGPGSLTARLARRVGRVIAVEKDARLLPRLEAAIAAHDTVRVVVGDALAMDWDALVGGAGAPFKIVGNIPYALTSPLIEKALGPPLPVVVLFLVQKDVADRLAAQPGTKSYGALTVGVQAVVRVERLLTVRAGSFHPPPRVESAVVRMTPLPEPLVADAERLGFRRFVTSLFGQRRKQLRRSLRSVLDLDQQAVERMLDRVGIEPTARPEVLQPLDLAALYRITGR